MKISDSDFFRARVSSMPSSVERDMDAFLGDNFLARMPRVLGPILLCGAAGTGVVLFWRSPYLLFAIMLGLMFLKQWLFPMRFDWLCFVIIAAMGATAETQIILGSGAWWYTETQIGVIPIWLAPLWGLVGTCLVTAYNALVLEAKIKK